MFIVYMFTYSLDNGKFIETEKLYPHDIALFLDKEQKKIYLWEGPYATTTVKTQAIPFIEGLKKKYDKFEFIEMSGVVPLNIQAELEKKLDKSFEVTKKIDRDPYFSLFVILSVGLFVLMIISSIFILSLLGWGTSELRPGIYIVSEVDYSNWIQNSKIMVLVTIIISELLFIDSFFTRKIFLIMTGMVTSLIQLGIYRYVSLGVFLFDFQAGADPGTYNILMTQVALFVILYVIGIVAILMPLIISISAILKDTKPISFKEWKEKKRQSEIKLNKFSVVRHKSSFINVAGANKPEELLSPEQIKALKEQKQEITVNLKAIDD